MSAQPSWDDDDGESTSDSAPAGSDVDDSVIESRGAAPDLAASPSAAPQAVGGEDVDARLARVGAALKDIQAPLRAYTAGWVLLQAGLTGYFAYDATQREHERALRASDIMRATISGLNTLLVLFKPMPGRSAYRKFKKMPEDTLADKRAKIDFGVRQIGAQVAADRKNAAPQEHVVAALVGIGFGAGLFFGYDQDNLRPAVETTLGVILLAELQFATRPWRVRRYNRELALPPKSSSVAVDVAVAPLVTQTSRGISLVGRF